MFLLYLKAFIRYDSYLVVPSLLHSVYMACDSQFDCFTSIIIVFLVLDEHFAMAINWTIAVCLFCYCSMQTVIEGHLSCFACACILQGADSDCQ